MIWREDFSKQLQEKVIFSIDQLEKSPQHPKEVFYPYYELNELSTYYRRGDTPAYTGNFIPIWLYPIFMDKVIMFIPPYRGSEDIYNYCGVTLDQLLELINADLVIPIIGNDLKAYEQKVFGKFIRKLPNNKPLIRAQLYEDFVLKNDFEFQQRVEERSKEYKKEIDKIAQSDKEKVRNYENERSRNPLIPEITKLPRFIAERVEWQELFGMKRNIEIIENSLKKDLITAYRVSRTLHYIVVPMVYSRGGFTTIAINDDIALTDEDGKFIAPAFPVGSEEIGFSRILPLPLQPLEVEKAVDLVIDIRKHDAKVDKEENKITGEVFKVMREVWNTHKFQKEPIEKYNENTAKLQKAFESFARKLIEERKRKLKDRDVIRTLSGGITDIPAALCSRDLRMLAESLENLTELVMSPLRAIFSLLIKAGLIKQNDPRIVEEVINQIRKLQGGIELWGEKEKMYTPFIIVKYDNPR